MSGHTKGPWAIVKDKYVVPETGPLRGYEIAITSDFGHIGDLVIDGTANARLIASAPDLLAALKDVMQHTREPCTAEGHAIAERARAAILKAEGK